MKIAVIWAAIFCFKKPDAGQVLQRDNLNVRFVQVLIVLSDVLIA